jgi:hypothetical protein
MEHHLFYFIFLMNKIFINQTKLTTLQSILETKIPTGKNNKNSITPRTKPQNKSQKLKQEPN